MAEVSGGISRRRPRLHRDAMPSSVRSQDALARNRPGRWNVVDGDGDEQKREELRQRLNAVSGVVIPPDGIGRRPSVPLAALQDSDIVQQFLSAFDWAIDEIKRAST